MKKSKLWERKIYIKNYERNYPFHLKHIKEILKKLKLSKKDIFLDLGCGNGEFLKHAAKKVSFAVGVDVSQKQLVMARKKLKKFKNMIIINSDFMNFVSKIKFTKALARKTLHHLTDRQKKIFFKKISKNFEPKSLFLIEDGIFFNFSRKEISKNWDSLTKDCEIYYGKDWEKKKKDVIYCFKQEYPTGIKEWEKALKAGNFKILKTEKYSSFYGLIIAQKES